MGLKDLGESYNFLLDLGIMIEVEILKCKGQKPVLKQISAIFMMFFRYTMSFMMILRCLHNNLLEPEVDELLHLQMALLNSTLEEQKLYHRFLSWEFIQEAAVNLLILCFFEGGVKSISKLIDF